MDLEPQRRQESPLPVRQKTPKPFLKEEEEEVVEGTTARDHKTQDFQDSPLKIFIRTEVVMLVAAIIMGIVIFLFFR